MIELTPQILHSLNLSPSQAAVYVAALELGQTTIQGLSKKSGVPRASIYTFIDQLRERQLMTETRKGKRNFFSATHPERLMEIEKTRMHDLAAAIPALSAIANRSRNKPRVTFYEGVEGMKTAYADSLTEKNSTIYGLTDLEAGVGVLGERYYQEMYLPERVRKGILYRGILRDNKTGRAYHQRDNKDLRESKMMPGAWVTVEMDIYGDKVAYRSHRSGAPFSVIIEDKDIADSMRTVWQSVWDRLPE